MDETLRNKTVFIFTLSITLQGCRQAEKRDPTGAPSFKGTPSLPNVA